MSLLLQRLQAQLIVRVVFRWQLWHQAIGLSSINDAAVIFTGVVTLGFLSISGINVSPAGSQPLSLPSLGRCVAADVLPLLLL